MKLLKVADFNSKELGSHFENSKKNLENFPKNLDKFIEFCQSGKVGTLRLK